MHNAVDWGAALEVFGMTAEDGQVIERSWSVIETSVKNMKVDWKKVVVYQDSFPYPAAKREFMDELRKSADKGSRQYQLVFWLQEQGARLERTERVRLLLAYNQVQQGEFRFARLPLAHLFVKNSLKRRIMGLRDRTIARRINMSLSADEVGMLFLGARHNEFRKHLSADIVVKKVVSFPASW